MTPALKLGESLKNYLKVGIGSHPFRQTHLSFPSPVKNQSSKNPDVVALFSMFGDYIIGETLGAGYFGK